MKNGNPRRRRAAENNLLCAKRGRRVQPCGPDCGQDAGEYSHRQQQERHNDEGHRVCGGNTEKLALKDSSCESGAGESNHQAGECGL